MSELPEKIAEGRYLRLVKRGSWEYVERVNVADVAVLVPVTAANEIVLVEQYRIPVLATMIELPAGLVGDEDGFRGESLRDAANRELEEETGFRADCLTLLARSPTSGGLTSETVAFLHATGLARVGLGGGVAGEDIRVHVVPLDNLMGWLSDRECEGCLIDPKIYAGVQLLKSGGTVAQGDG